MSDEVLDVLTHGKVTPQARFANSSNQTILVAVELEGVVIEAVYKPEAGERPLWDFPPGLWRREIAAYVLSEQLGLHLVPVTIARDDGPFGPGSLQELIDEDMENHYFTLREDPANHEAFRSLAAFDVVANNSDRKSGHVLKSDSGLWAIDHGLCFHEEDKLRTVIWEHAGEPLDEQLAESIRHFADHPDPQLHGLISRSEIEATCWRATTLVESGSLPAPDEDGPYPPYPWPLV